MVKTAISLTNVTKKFSAGLSGSVVALQDVSFSLQENSCTLIAGANGSGKSVLMNIIAGILTQTSGSVTVNGRAGLVFQDASAQILGETPREDCAFGPQNMRLSRKEISDRVTDALTKTGLLEKADFPARFLSGGEKRRLAVAGILAMDLPIIIFDEPYANLDYDGVRQVNALIKMLKGAQKTIIILTHELEKSLALCDQLVVLFHGDVVFKGTPENGLGMKLEEWGIRNPLLSYTELQDLIWE